MTGGHNLSFQTTIGVVQIPITPGNTVLVAGPNGVGKSALLATLYRSLPQAVATYLPGDRQINFNNGWETIGQDAAQLKQNMFANVDHFSRYKGAWAEDQFKATIRALLHSEAAFNRTFRKMGSSDESISGQDGSLRVSPVDTLNLIFEAARLPVRFDLTVEGLSATRGSAVYAIDALSDGERAALFIVAAIVTLGPDGVILIDEPEKHLHPSITGLLIEAALRAKKDAMVVLASHDFHLIEQLAVSSIVHIRNSTIINSKPEYRNYEANVISNPGSISEDLKRDLLGARSTILFVEGEHYSSDLALYGHVYDGVKISPKGGHSQVSESVKALRLMDGQHWIKPYGLVDGDGRDVSEIQKLKSRGVFVLPCPTIENLFFLPHAVACFVCADNGHHLGKSLAGRVQDMFDVIVKTSIEAKDDIVAKRVAWLLERKLSAKKLSPKQIRSKQFEDISVSVHDIIEAVEKRFDEILSYTNWEEIIFSLPIKNTKLPSVIALSLGATSFDQYCQVILRQLDIKSDFSKPLLESLREILPPLDGREITDPQMLHGTDPNGLLIQTA